MKRRAAAIALGLAALLPPPAHANVLLDGDQHIGDQENASFTPRDEVLRAQMQANPSYFVLSTRTTITAVTLDNPNDLDNQLRVFIDDMSTPIAGALSGSTYTFTTPQTLAAGVHTIWPDGGCSGGGFGTCLVGENDFGFSSITLASAQVSFARMISRRSHVGNNNDSDDNYGGRWYPDKTDGSSATFTFSIDAARVLSEIRFYRVRDLSAAPVSFPAVTIDGTSMGTLTTNGTVTLTPGTLLASGSHSLTVAAGTASGTDLDDFSWDDIVLVFINNPATAPGMFNAVDTGNSNVASGPITTKIAGGAQSFDVVAVTGNALFTGYAGSVTVELVDSTDSTTQSCSTWPAVLNLGSVTFTAGDAGRKAVTFTHAEALKNVSVRITESSLQITSCSVDNFAIRPDRFDNVVVSHFDSATPGTAQNLPTAGITASTTPVHKAGQYFTIQADAYNSAGAVTTYYAGSPDLTALSDTLGSVTGTANASGWTYPNPGSIRSDAVSYSEAGAPQLKLVDTSFAAVDADDTATANLEISATLTVGRFIPDHFTFTEVTGSEAEFASQCGTFTYVGQPFSFITGKPTPSALIRAVNASGSLTQNYDGTLYKLPTGGFLPNSTYAAATGTLDTGLVPTPDNTFVNQGGGKSLFTLTPATTYRFTRGTPVAPFQAQITITPTLNESDGVTFAAGSSSGFGTAPVLGGIPFDGGNQMRYGRLVVDNAHGSERLPLNVPLRTEYWYQAAVGEEGFVLNTADTCTILATTDVSLGTPTPPTLSVSITPPVTSPGLAAGNGYATIGAPNATGYVDVTALLASVSPTPLTWLLGDWNPIDGTWSENPSGRATFGLHSGDDRRIYQREVIQ